MHCANCQQEVPDESPLCPVCGAPFAYPQPAYYIQQPKARVSLRAYLLLGLVVALLVLIFALLVSPTLTDNNASPTWESVNILQPDN
jgi:hypothetical protein